MATEASSRTTTTQMKVIYCIGWRNGHRCNQPLFHVVKAEQENLPASVQSKCPKCGDVYTLADYRKSV